jgi:hypothetical protein
MRRTQRGGIFGLSRSNLHEAIVNNNDDAVREIIRTMSEDEKRKQVNAVTAGGKTALSLLVKTQNESKGLFGTKPKICTNEINQAIYSMLIPYANEATKASLAAAIVDCPITEYDTLFLERQRKQLGSSRSRKRRTNKKVTRKLRR